MQYKGVSIIISTYNGTLRLEKTLKALSELNISEIPYVELILVDNGSTDNSLVLAQNTWKSLNTPFAATFLAETTPGKLHAQEKGLRHVKGKYVLICDDDNSLFQDYLHLGYNYMETHPEIGVLGGRGVGVSSIPFPDWFEQYSYYYGCTAQAPQTGNVRPVRNVVHGAGMFFRYEAYLKGKAFGYEFILASRVGDKLITGAEDSELCWMLIYQGYEIWYIDEMKFYHHITENRLTEKYREKLLWGMTENGLNSTIHQRIWSGSIRKKVKLFWLKEAVYSLFYLFSILFSTAIKTNKWSDSKRIINNIKILLTDRGKYDEKINALLNYKLKCTTHQPNANS